MSQTEVKPLAVAIMAAGKGTRMKRDDIPKVCNLANGKPLIGYVVDQAKSLNAERIICIIGHMKEKVEETLANESVIFAYQLEQLGTGHAVMQAAEALKDFQGELIVLSGDVPLLQVSTLEKLLETHRNGSYVATVLTALAEDPAGYGRVVRKQGSLFDRIVEHKDASEEILEIKEINSGIYVFDAEALLKELPNVGKENAQGEYYLPDVLPLLQASGYEVGVEICETFSEIQGINTVDELKAVEELILKRMENR